MDRRPFLLGTTGVLASCAGCSALSSQPVMLGLVVFNHTDSLYTVQFDLLRTDGKSSQSEGPANPKARVHSERIDIEPREDGVNRPSMTRREDVAETRQYVVRYEVWKNNNSSTDEGHVHFFPTGDGDADYVVFDIYSEGTLERR
ncbi:hypothetical protein NDI56_17250 [Haloarcula sp. S1CR25-12]|uniref:Tat pathway signal sequence domain protein n=1 Tax=Haloarcula saliterrae TaxID=2950534 RepID=A0ABU2FFV6_9EURY|nr:hypothetical protein [Haloarcula sp. S1CR25-12]MDS0261149.1 hypothetical protein [Haloarcula sp. S1CR25-12]